MKPNIVKKKKNRQTKTFLVFDEEARKDFLTGFQKRKNERRKRAKEEMDKKLKEERRRIKEEHRNEMLKYREETEKCLLEMEGEEAPSTSIDLPHHTVTIVDLAKGNGTRLGANNDESEDESKSENTDEKKNVSEDNKSSKKLTLKRQLQLRPKRHKKHINKSHLMDKHRIAASSKRNRKRKKQKPGRQKPN